MLTFVGTLGLGANFERSVSDGFCADRLVGRVAASWNRNWKPRERPLSNRLTVNWYYKQQDSNVVIHFTAFFSRTGLMESACDKHYDLQSPDDPTRCCGCPFIDFFHYASYAVVSIMLLELFAVSLRRRRHLVSYADGPIIGSGVWQLFDSGGGAPPNVRQRRRWGTIFDSVLQRQAHRGALISSWYMYTVLQCYQE
jgi:hypothetical protein